MTVNTVAVLPGALTLDDQVYDPHTGFRDWAAIVCLMRDGDDVVITLASDPTPLRVPAHLPMQVHRRPSPSEADVAEFHPDAEVADAAHLSGMYAGDLAALAQAARARRESGVPAVEPETPAAAALRPLVAMYGGDLELVMEAIAGVAPDQVLAAARHAALAQSGANHVTPKPVEDDQVGAVTAAEVEERLGGWYAGDLAALLAPPPDAQPPAAD